MKLSSAVYTGSNSQKYDNNMNIKINRNNQSTKILQFYMIWKLQADTDFIIVYWLLRTNSSQNIPLYVAMTIIKNKIITVVIKNYKILFSVNVCIYNSIILHITGCN